MEINYFSKLPNELIFIIFKKLNVRDLSILRIVNKRFKKISEHSVDELIVLDGIPDNFWYLTDCRKSPTKTDLIPYDKYSAFRSIFKLELSLKRLELNDNDFVLSDLNSFKNLEHLEIVCQLKSDTELDLPKLKLISICLVNNDLKLNNYKLNLKSKKLEVVCFGDTNNSTVTVAYPENVKHLMLDSSNYNIEPFKNLEHLTLYFNSYLDKDILTKFKRLKILDLELEEDEQFLNAFHHVLKQRLVLRRSDLILRLYNVEIYNQSMLEEYSRLSSFEFQLKNLDQLTGCMSEFFEIQILDYEFLLRHFESRIPKSFYDKFFNLSVVNLGNLESFQEDQCRSFLSNLICLKSLHLTDCDFSQSFYDKLVDFEYLDSLEIVFQDEFEISDDYSVHIQNFKNIRYLNVECDDKTIDDTKTMIKMDFVFKFKELRVFNIQFKIANPFEFTNKLFENSNCLKTFKFKFKNVFYNITKQSNGAFKVRVTRNEMYEDEEVFEEDDKDEIFLAFDLDMNVLRSLPKFKFPAV